MRQRFGGVIGGVDKCTRANLVRKSNRRRGKEYETMQIRLGHLSGIWRGTKRAGDYAEV